MTKWQRNSHDVLPFCQNALAKNKEMSDKRARSYFGFSDSSALVFYLIRMSLTTGRLECMESSLLAKI